MKYTFLFSFLTAVLLASCTKEGGENVQVQFMNATGQRISDITVDNIPIGDMQAWERTEYYKLPGFGTDTGMPDADFVGTLNGIRVRSTSDFYWCGTEKSKLPSGRYEVRVELSTYNNQNYFTLRFE